MNAIIIGLIVTLIFFVIVVSAIQQNKEKKDAEKRARVSKYKAILDENEEILINLGNLPPSPNLVKILNIKSLNATKSIQEIMPETAGIKDRIQSIRTSIETAEKSAENNHADNDDIFIVPDNEQQILSILQCIKKVRATLKSEQNKGTVEAQIFTKESNRLNAMQLKINIESLVKRGKQAQSKDMLGSARQYFEKALQTLAKSPIKTEYVSTKQEEITNQLAEITNALKSTNAQDAVNKAKNEENDLDSLFQPKKKW